MALARSSGYDLCVAGQDEAQARATLLAMQARLRDPHDALGLSGSATPAEVRSAFLALTKRFHPARFGRMPAEIQRLANEVFLGLRAAHDALSRPAIKSTRQSGSMPILQPRTTTRPMGTPPATTPPATTRTSGPTQPQPRAGTTPVMIPPLTMKRRQRAGSVESSSLPEGSVTMKT